MAEKNQTTHPFVNHLVKLTSDRGALAALRRGLGRKPGEAPEMYPYVVPWLPERIRMHEETAYYLVAALFAYHSSSSSTGNMGAHLAQTIPPGADNQAVERRFVALLSSHSDDLPDYLRQAVSYLKSKNVPVNWSQLLRDITNWDHEDRFVQRAWASAFWGRSSETHPTE